LAAKTAADPYFVLQVAFCRRDVEPPMHGEYAHVEAIEFEGGAKALADGFGAEGKGAQQPHLLGAREQHDQQTFTGVPRACLSEDLTGSFILSHMEVKPMPTMASSTTRQNMR
jgi:hypothetical protein